MLKEPKLSLVIKVKKRLDFKLVRVAKVLTSANFSVRKECCAQPLEIEAQNNRL